MRTIISLANEKSRKKHLKYYYSTSLPLDLAVVVLPPPPPWRKILNETLQWDKYTMSWWLEVYLLIGLAQGWPSKPKWTSVLKQKILHWWVSPQGDNLPVEVLGVELVDILQCQRSPMRKGNCPMCSVAIVWLVLACPWLESKEPHFSKISLIV